MVQRAAMPVAHSIDKVPPAACRGCGTALSSGNPICTVCGAANGESNRCPHCNILADVEPHASLGFRCLVCGGPRLPANAQGVHSSAATKAALETAGREHTKHLMFLGAGWLLASIGGLALLVATVVILAVSPGLVASLATLLACGVPLASGIVALSRARSARNVRGDALRRAQVSTLSDVQAVNGVMDAERAARLLHIDPDRAELLLAEASVGALLGQAPVPRVRVTPTETAVGAESETDHIMQTPRRGTESAE